MNNSRTIPKYAGIIAAAVIFIILLTLFGIYDYDISSAIADPSNVFWHAFEIIGEVPAVLVAIFAINVLTVPMIASKDKKKIALAVLYWLGCFGGFYYICNVMFKYAGASGSPWYVSIPVCAAAEVVSFLLIRTILKKSFGDDCFSFERGTDFYVFRKKCEITALNCVLTLLIVSGLKVIWSRPRFRTLSSADEYFPFWMPRGIAPFLESGSSVASFPSGHTANAACLYCLSLFPKSKKNRQIAKIILIIWIGFMAACRVFAGAHYASDVLCGMTITLLLHLLSKKIIAKTDPETVSAF